MNSYLFHLQKTEYSPNFYCSDEYFEKANMSIEVETDIQYIKRRIYLLDNENVRLLPTIEIIGNFYDYFARIGKDYIFQSGFSNYEEGEFWDYEFIYDPKNFLDLSGGKWKKVRKNINWVKKKINEDIQFSPYIENDKLNHFLDLWFHKNRDVVFYDPEVMVNYVYHGNNRLFLIGNESGRLYGICIWDENYKYINFRFCLVDPNIKGLSDFCRVKFYIFMAHETNKLVNDGGSLGNQGLYEYKKYLNPIEINEIRSTL